MKNYSTIFWLVIIALGATLYLMGNIGDEDQAEPTPTITPTPTVEVSTATPTNASTPTPTATPREGEPFSGFPDQGLVGETPPRSWITGPAACQLSGGTITFLDKNTAVHDSAYIAYQNVDHPGRLIYWDVNHDGEILGIGPNIFSSLVLPNGQQDVNVVIDGEPRFDSYLLTARITYALLDENGGIIKMQEANCTGNIVVNLDYLK